MSGFRLTARLRLTLSYALFLVCAGAVTMAVVYVGMRYVPNYPLAPANPRETRWAPSRGEILDTLLTASGWALALLAVIGLGGGWLVAGRVLRPLQEINRAARRAAEGSLDHRIGLTGRRDEFTDLSDTFDLMLDRLQASFERQRRFAANASHELRTPLSVTRTMLDVAIADPGGQDHVRLLRRLRETNERGVEVVDALLRLSAIDGAPVASAPEDLARTTARALHEVREEAAALGVTLAADLAPAPVAGDGALLVRMAANLLRNALRHNLPEGGSASVRTGTGDGGSRLVVRNTGPVVPADLVGALTEPFFRARGRTADPDPARRGHGLGLPLAAAVVDAHGGRLDLAPEPGGGLAVTVTLPSGAASARPRGDGVRSPRPSRAGRGGPDAGASSRAGRGPS
ncbi:sensor histidine kinase [Actinomadura kijaniata]|uniref:sensor histidine kinase n=1 Tax=Actinomadura kijaniata TaxID=46161 RepID=UPI00082F0B02|nr:HAMP domain-containing sensor histidine kinase [Actinomadura kijaniata]